MILALEEILDTYQTNVVHHLPVLVYDWFSPSNHTLDRRNPCDKRSEAVKIGMVLDTKLTFLPDINLYPIIIVLPGPMKGELEHPFIHVLPLLVQDRSPILFVH